MYAITGNGRFDGAAGGRDFGNSVLALALDHGTVKIVDSFTPFDESKLDAVDGDLGSGGPMLMQDRAGARGLIFASKAGKLYLLDPDHLGGFHAGDDTGARQAFETSDGEYGSPAGWNGHVYLQGSDVPLFDFGFAGGRLTSTPVARSSAAMPNPGATPTVSANGSHDGIVWLVQSKPFGTDDRPAVLHAYEGADVAHELYTSEQNPARDRAGTALRFNIPTVADGKVYVGTRGGIDVYGLLGAQRRRPG